MRIPVNGIELHTEVAGAGRPLVLLHGFTGNADTWSDLTARLGGQRRTIAVDIIGHGRSAAPGDPERYRMDRCVADLLALLDTLATPVFDLVGYSMGARVALQVAAAAPERIGVLILEGGSPGLATAAEREARAKADGALADGIDHDGLETFIDRWENIPLFASQKRLPAEIQAAIRAARLANPPHGLANSLRGMGTGRQTSLWDRLAALTMPTLLLAGELDEKYCEIGRAMAVAMPNARFAAISDAGHAAHLEQPEAFAAAVLAFLPAHNPGIAALIGNRKEQGR